MPTLILFHDLNTSYKFWSKQYTTNCDLIEPIKLVGNVIAPTIPYANLSYYINKDFFDKPALLKTSDLTLDLYITKLRDDITYKPPFIIICNGHGIYYGLEFCKKFFKECKLLISLNGSWISNKNLSYSLDNWKNDKLLELNNQSVLNDVQNKIKNGQHELIEQVFNYIKITHTKYALKNNFEVLKIPMILFRDIPSDNIIYKVFAMQEYESLNKQSLFKQVTLSNATNFVWTTNFNLIISMIQESTQSDNIIKKLGYGTNGVSYLILKNDKFIVKKRQKLPDYELNKNMYRKVWKEIYFYSFIDTLSDFDKKFFSVLYNYKVSLCDYKHEIITTDSYINSRNKIRNNSLYCIDTYIEYKGTSVTDIIYKFTKNDIYSLIIQLIYAIKILKTHGYIHNDIHTDNITRIDGHPIINNYKFNYQYAIIDYGRISHLKYCADEYALSLHLDKIDFDWDILEMINNVVIRSLSLHYINNINIPYISDNQKFKIYQNNHKLFNKCKHVLFQIYPDLKHSFDINKLNKSVKLTFDILIAAFDKEFYIKTLKLYKYDVPNLLSSDEIVYILTHLNNYNNIIDFFIEKIKN